MAELSLDGKRIRFNTDIATVIVCVEDVAVLCGQKKFRAKTEYNMINRDGDSWTLTKKEFDDISAILMTTEVFGEEDG